MSEEVEKTESPEQMPDQTQAAAATPPTPEQALNTLAAAARQARLT